MDLNIALNSNGSRHLYVQIYEYIRDEIRTGRIGAGERLPSTRVLSEKLHIARTTVELAYEQLEDEGYIEIRRGSGAYACDIGNLTNLSDAKREDQSDRIGAADDWSSGIRPIVSRKRSADGPLPENPVNPGPKNPEAGKMIDFSPREIDMSEFPYTTWRRIMRNVLTGDRSDLFGRGDPQGDPEFRETIAHYLHLSRGCRCTSDQIVIGAGSDYLMMVLSMVLGEGRRVGMESPTYSRMAKILTFCDDVVVPVRADDAGMCVDALEEADCDLAYVMPARQYPTGVSMPYSRRAHLLKWAGKTEEIEEPEYVGRGQDNKRSEPRECLGRFIIEDDYDSEFKYRGHPLPSLQSQDTADRVIYMGTFSKTIAPAIRVSYMILPRCLLNLYHERAGVLSCTVPRLDQAILNEFIRDGHFERYLNKMRNHYRIKHDLMVKLLKESGLLSEPIFIDSADELTKGNEQEPSDIQMKSAPGGETFQFVLGGEGAGLHLLLSVCAYSGRNSDFKRSPGYGGRNDDSKALFSCKQIEKYLTEKAAKSGVIVHPMSHLYLKNGLPEGQDTPPVLLLGYAALSETEIREGIRRLKICFSDKQSARR